MIPTYIISSILNNTLGKFVVMVSFNGRAAERYEIELSPEVVAVDVTPLSDAQRIDAILLQAAADLAASSAAELAKEAAIEQVKITNGKIVI